ncbi:MAG: TolC family protein [Kiritimatiellae bacterium]|nr:TolC family protein [Kiritimatiellia bacterium]
MDGMIFKARYLLAAAAVLAAMAGCDTIHRARTAQKAVAAATNDMPAAVSKPLPRVNLLGAKFIDFVEFAMTNRPSLEVARLAVSNAALSVIEATADRELQMNLAGGYSQATANGGSHFSWHQRRGKGTGDITFDLLLVDCGRIDARERQAREDLVAAQRDLEEAEFKVFAEVAETYFILLRNDALLEVAHTNEYQYAEHLRQAEQLHEAGEAQKLDVLKARVDLSDARLLAINASNDVLTAGAEFLRALGLQADRASRADVLRVAKDTFAASARRELPVTRFRAEDGLQLARTNAPSLRALRARLRAASAEVDYAVADLLPKLSLSSAFSFADPAWNWSWGFSAIQTVLDGYRKRTAVDHAVVAMESARLAVDEAEQALSRDLAVAVATRDNARQSLETARIEVEQAKENLQTVIEQYRLGEASRVDFTDAAGSYASALGARVKAFYAGEIAEAALIRLTGTVPPRTSPKTGEKKQPQKKAVVPSKPGTYREVTDETID